MEVNYNINYEFHYVLTNINNFVFNIFTQSFYTDKQCLHSTPEPGRLIIT